MRRAVVLVVLAVAAVACGSSEADESSTANSTTTSGLAPTTSPSSDPPASSTTSGPATTEVTATTVGDAVFYDQDAEALFAFLDTVPDEPFFMVNVLRHRERAVYEDGRVTDLTGAEADGIYTDFMLTEMLPSIGAEIVWAGAVEQDMAGAGDYQQIGVVRYPSGEDFRSMVEDPMFQEMLAHKRAGVEDTITLATTRLDTPSVAPLDDPPHPATDDDLPFAFVHVLDYRELAQYAPGDDDADPNRPGDEAVSLYTNNAGTVAAPLGIRPVAWFEVEAVVTGDPGWQEVRINAFPSHATFTALTSDPTWQAGAHHRTAGLEKTHAFMTSPILIDTFSP